MKTVASVPYSYEVLVDDDGRHYLDVEYGMHAVYTVRVELTVEETAAFQADPSSVESLVKKVQHHGKRP